MTVPRAVSDGGGGGSVGEMFYAVLTARPDGLHRAASSLHSAAGSLDGDRQDLAEQVLTPLLSGHGWSHHGQQRAVRRLARRDSQLTAIHTRLTVGQQVMDGFGNYLAAAQQKANQLRDAVQGLGLKYTQSGTGYGETPLTVDPDMTGTKHGLTPHQLEDVANRLSEDVEFLCRTTGLMDRAAYSDLMALTTGHVSEALTDTSASPAMHHRHTAAVPLSGIDWATDFTSSVFWTKALLDEIKGPIETSKSVGEDKIARSLDRALERNLHDVSATERRRILDQFLKGNELDKLSGRLGRLVTYKLDGTRIPVVSLVFGGLGVYENLSKGMSWQEALGRVEVDQLAGTASGAIAVLLVTDMDGVVVPVIIAYVAGTALGDVMKKIADDILFRPHGARNVAPGPIQATVDSHGHVTYTHPSTKTVAKATA